MFKKFCHSLSLKLVNTDLWSLTAQQVNSINHRQVLILCNKNKGSAKNVLRVCVRVCVCVCVCVSVCMVHLDEVASSHNSTPTFASFAVKVDTASGGLSLVNNIQSLQDGW